MSVKSTVPFKGTPEQAARLNDYIKANKNTPGSILPILQEAQHIYGYLPFEVQTIVAEGLSIPLSEVYGVITFYTQFALSPKGKYRVSVCLGTACYVKGAGDILDEFKKRLGLDVGDCSADGKFSLDATRCIGACGLAPVMTVNDDVFGKITKADVDKILARYA